MLTADAVRKGKRVLILAHRGELLDQAAAKLEAATGLGCSVEKAESTAVDSWFMVTVGSVQTLMRESRLKRFSPDHFDVIIVDEAHHILADSYQAPLNYFAGANVLGVTATSDRGDKKDLGQYFDSCAYEYSLPSAIKDGYLCPIKAQTIPIKLDLRGVGVQAGDFKVSDIDSALDPYLDQIANEMIEYCSDRKTVVFLPLIATSQKFARLLNAKGLKACEVNGESKDRTEVIAAFDRGEYNVLCNSMLLTEGWDCPSVDCIIVLRPTKIRSLYAQMVGRGTRLHPGKDHLLILDFLWHTERHELCRPANLITDNPDVAAVMTEAIEGASCPIDIEEAEIKAESDVAQKREEALARKLAELKTRKRKLVDPLWYEMSIQAVDLMDYVPTLPYEMGPPSGGQLATLEKFGIYPDEVTNAGYASMLIDRLIKRRNEGYTTPRQIRQLEQRGFKHVGQWSLSEASALINRIQANGWSTPANIDPSTYNPTI